MPISRDVACAFFMVLEMPLVGVVATELVSASTNELLAIHLPDFGVLLVLSGLLDRNAEAPPVNDGVVVAADVASEVHLALRVPLCAAVHAHKILGNVPRADGVVDLQ